MRKARRPKTTEDFIYAELRLIRNELKKLNATQDELLRIAIEHFEPYDEDDDRLLR